MSVGFSVAVIDEDGTQQLHITEVKASGLASAKGICFYLYLLDIHITFSMPGPGFYCQRTKQKKMLVTYRN